MVSVCMCMLLCRKFSHIVSPKSLIFEHRRVLERKITMLSNLLKSGSVPKRIYGGNNLKVRYSLLF